MIVKTKKYQLETSTYIKLGLTNILKEQWWVVLIAIAIGCGYFWIDLCIDVFFLEYNVHPSEGLDRSRLYGGTTL